MMNKQKSRKAWRWKVATFLPLLALLLMAFGKAQLEKIPAPLNQKNSFLLADKFFKLDHCFVANESSTQFSKFEIDLIGGEPNDGNFRDTTKIKHYIWLSLTSSKSDNVENGEYKYSKRNINDREAMTFSGAISIGNKSMDIIGGKLVIKKISNQLDIDFSLSIDKNNDIKGSFTGEYNYFNRTIK